MPQKAYYKKPSIIFVVEFALTLLLNLPNANLYYG